MGMINRTFIAFDGHKMYTYFFIPEGKPKAIVQIVHGLGEHAGRYTEFAERLSKEGFLVCAEDHRGFGRSTVSKDQIGHISDENGHNLIIGDMLKLMEHTKSEHNNIPYFMFGHSMGSFLTRSFLIRYPNSVSGIILSGTKGKSSPIEGFGKTIAGIQKFLFGGRKRAKLLSKMSVGGYGKKYFPKDNSSLAWLTSDKEVIERIKEDEYFSNKPESVETYLQLFSIIEDISNKEKHLKLPKNLPVLLVSGDKDPVGNFGIGVKWVFDLYKSVGLNDVTIKLFEGGRHELLNDKYRYEVMDLIVDWLNKRIS